MAVPPETRDLEAHRLSCDSRTLKLSVDQWCPSLLGSALGSPSNPPLVPLLHDLTVLI